MSNIAINGFGRIGRLFFRRSFDSENLKVVAINDLAGLENLAYLLKYDTVFGKFNKEVSVKDGALIVDGREIKFFQEKEPQNLPWGKMGVDVVVEATGAFTKYENAKAHLDAGAKRVVITAPAKDEDGELGQTCLVGINEEDIRKVKITSNGSCTTNAAAPVIKVLDEKIGIEKAMLNTIHGYTASQAIVDSPVKGDKFRSGRAGAQNIIPSTTGAAIAVSRVLPKMKGKFDGIALRVPVIAGSVADITFLAKRNTTTDEVNEILKTASKDPAYEGVLTVTEDPIVSSDIIGEPYGAIVDLGFTNVVGGNLVKVLSWYDNEMGYVSTLIKHVEKVIE